jgi:DNA-directed RNA polymerase subunit M/transcription elongation factor TFIIS
VSIIKSTGDIMTNKNEVEIVESEKDDLNNSENPEDGMVEQEVEKKKVRTTCPKCKHGIAFLNGSMRSGARTHGSHPMNMIQYQCESCGHTWSLGY